VALKSGLYVLPATDGCVETMQWLAQEAREEGADPIVIRAEMLEGISEIQIIELFREARREDYTELLTRADAIDAQSHRESADARTALRTGLERLRADYQQILRIDHFGTPEGRQVGARVDALTELLAGPPRTEPAIPSLPITDYRGRQWVTRPRPFADRLACLWLIRRFIDPEARVRYSDTPADNEVPFDMNEGTFHHVGNRCTFEVMMIAFGLDQPGLAALGEIVHEIDLHDGRYARPEVLGIEGVLIGWNTSGWPDEVVEAAGLTLFDGLHASKLT